MNDTWNNVFFDIVEERPVKADVHTTGLVRVTTTPIQEISPERIRPDQELIAIEIQERDLSRIENALRDEGFSQVAISQILDYLPA